MVAVWLSPDTLVKTVLKPVFSPIMRFFGIDQTWMMFCPIVRDTNFYLNSAITFADGSTKLFEPPRLDLYDDLFRRFCRHRMNKAFHDAWERPTLNYYWPYIAAYIARCNLNPSNQPVLVTLSINYSMIPSIDNWVSRENLPSDAGHATYFVYKVRPEDLK